MCLLGDLRSPRRGRLRARRPGGFRQVPPNLCPFLQGIVVSEFGAGEVVQIQIPVRDITCTDDEYHHSMCRPYLRPTKSDSLGIAPDIGVLFSKHPRQTPACRQGWYEVRTPLPLEPPVSLRNPSETVKDVSSHSCVRISGFQGKCPTPKYDSSGLKD